ncbi:carbohydrate kinase family protein [Saccharothrix sp. ST-888]|uniref:carbohydrate kinase family protein n=1 Tax=Saccharothrix sp. ST-888 TaxID=1427391 RepID=UPI0005EC4A12|nr:PfkB family carbohydrate kinase [Saccharothrix sp. ST-888]KJK56716.1 sugar kinase [Saccharothrix sp. ST-888]
MSRRTAGNALLVIGDVVTDIVALHANALAPDTDTAARIAFRPGGSGANTAAWAACSGTEVRLLARVGANSADWHRDELRAAGVEPHLVVDGQAATAVVISLVDAGAERTLVTDSGAAVRLCSADWDAALLDGAARVHLSGYLYFTDAGRQLAATVHTAARAAGIPVSVDPASTGFIEVLGLPAFLAAVGGTGLVLPNLAEARLLAGTADPVAAAERLSAVHGEAVVKLGAAGALAARQGELLARVPGVAALAVDSTGAGDAFTGGFLAARLSGADLVEATEAGCRTGAAAVEVLGGRPPVRG